MNIEKIRNLGPDELLHQQRDAADQLFRLKFQLKMGQTTGIKKMRELRKDLARIKTITRERQLGINHQAKAAAAARPEYQCFGVALPEYFAGAVASGANTLAFAVADIPAIGVREQAQRSVRLW